MHQLLISHFSIDNCIPDILTLLQNHKTMGGQQTPTILWTDKQTDRQVGKKISADTQWLLMPQAASSLTYNKSLTNYCCTVITRLIE